MISHAVYPLALHVALRPPDGNEDASGSPISKSFPVNVFSIFPSVTVEENESCFSAPTEITYGWNTCVKCVAPFSNAHSFIACATTSANSSVISPPWYIRLLTFS